jgi:hypothetical protein
MSAENDTEQQQLLLKLGLVHKAKIILAVRTLYVLAMVLVILASFFLKFILFTAGIIEESFGESAITVSFLVIVILALYCFGECIVQLVREFDALISVAHDSDSK